MKNIWISSDARDIIFISKQIFSYLIVITELLPCRQHCHHRINQSSYRENISQFFLCYSGWGSAAKWYKTMMKLYGLVYVWCDNLPRHHVFDYYHALERLEIGGWHGVKKVFIRKFSYLCQPLLHATDDLQMSLTQIFVILSLLSWLF